MPLKIVDIDTTVETVIDIIEFIEDGDIPHFRVKSDGDIGINIKYIPVSKSEWDKDRFDVFLFENPYLEAENDVFELYESTIDERIGWVFPLTILESNDNDYRDFKNLNQYKFITYKRLLEFDKIIPTRFITEDFVKLSDIFGDVIVCSISRDASDRITDFDFNNYILSFHKLGYLRHFDDFKSKPIYDKTDFINNFRQRKRINITKSNFNVLSNDFTKSLYLEHLLQSESYIIRHLFLYQIIEYFIQTEFDIQFNQHLEDYQNKRIAKNDFKENIITSSRERDLIRSVINRIQIEQEIVNEYKQECDSLFVDIGFNYKDSFPDKLYDIRNLITHRLREIMTKSETLKRITEIFERIIIDLLINFH